MGRNLQEVVIAAEELSVPRKALVRQLGPTLAARHTLGVPRLLRHVEEVAIQDRLITASAPDHLHHDPTSPSHRLLNRSFLFRRRADAKEEGR